MPRASDSTATVVMKGVRRSVRSASLRLLMADLRQGAGADSTKDGATSLGRTSDRRGCSSWRAVAAMVTLTPSRIQTPVLPGHSRTEAAHERPNPLPAPFLLRAVDRAGRARRVHPIRGRGAGR